MQWTLTPIGAHSLFLALAQKSGAQNELDRSFADPFPSRGGTPSPQPGADFVGRRWIRSPSIRHATRFPVGVLSGILETTGSQVGPFGKARAADIFVLAPSRKGISL